MVDPTQEEIRERAERIRANWSRDEERRRQVSGSRIRGPIKTSGLNLSPEVILEASGWDYLSDKELRVSHTNLGLSSSGTLPEEVPAEESAEEETFVPTVVNFGV